MSWKTLVPHANTKASGLECRMAISEAGRVTLRASAQVFAEAGIAMGDRVVVALGEGEDAGWLRLSKSDRGWKVGSNASGPEQRATYKITFTPQRGLFPEARKSYEVHWIVGGGLFICWDEQAAKKTPRSMEQPSDPMTEGNVPDYFLLAPSPVDDFVSGPVPGTVHFHRKEVVPVAKPTATREVVAQPPSPEPAAGAVTPTTPLGIDQGIKQGDLDAEAETLAELTMAVAGIAVDQERAEKELTADALGPQRAKHAKPRNPPPPWGEADANGVAKHGDEYLPLTTPETWKELRQIRHEVAAAGAKMSRVNVPMPGRDRMKLNGVEMTPEECLEKARVIVKEWEAAA